MRLPRCGAGKIAAPFLKQSDLNNMKKLLSCCGVLCVMAAFAAKSSAALIQVQPLVSNQVQLTWQSNSNLSQELQHSPNLVNWQIVMRPYPAIATNSTTTNVQPAAASNDFFRLQFFSLTNTPVPTVPGMHTNRLLVSGRLTRTYRLFIPPGYNATNAPAPLSVIMHGGGQSADLFAALHPDLFPNAATNGMILVLPDATPRDGVLNWNNSELRPYETDIDDVQFILDLVNVLKCSLNIDNLRVYAGGFSSGGQMVHQLGEKTTNVFAALASVGASIASSQDTNTPLVMPPPSLEPYPILIVNATNDCTRTYYGGVNIDHSLQASVASAANYWVTNNGCTTNNVSYFVISLVTNYNRVFRFQTECYLPPVSNQNALVTNLAVLAHFAGCGSNKVVEVVSLSDGGHTWQDLDDNIGFDANSGVIAFFLQHARSNYVAPTWTGLQQFSVTSPIQNGDPFQAQITLQNPGAGIIPCGDLRWFNPNLNNLRFTSWNTPTGSMVETNNDGDLLWNFDRIPGNSSLTLNVSGVVNVTFGAGQEFYNLISSVRISVAGGSFTTNIMIKVLSPMDYGDAPAQYPTLYADNGARHSISALRLGASMDVERDGFPSTNADGDDNNNNPDDENGVQFLNPPQAGQVIGIAIFASAAGKVDAWVDYNRDGTWTNGNEQILASLPVSVGSNYVGVLLDPAAATGVTAKTYWRFRISTAGGLAPGGFAPDGEVEDYATTMLAVAGTGNTNAGAGHVDWGDAPAAYPVLAADYGASHLINDGLCLGAGVDAETNGQPHINARGDDNNGDDEDGVNISALTRSPNPLAFETVQVNVQGQGYLNAWIDFNGDGDWNDAGEQIVTSKFITVGGNPNLISFHVPGNTVLGATFARFRYGVDAAVPPTGGANEGEVEDYKVTISLP